MPRPIRRGILSAITRGIRQGATATPPETSYVLSMSGANILELPSEILIPTGQVLTAFFRVVDDSAPRVIWSGVTTPRCYSYVSAGTIISPEAATIKVDGFDTAVFPSDGDMHRIDITFTQDVYLDRFGLSHTDIFSMTGQVRDITLPSGEFFPVNDNTQTITGSLGTVMSLTGGLWEEYEVTNV